MKLLLIDEDAAPARACGSRQCLMIVADAYTAETALDEAESVGVRDPRICAELDLPEEAEGALVAAFGEYRAFLSRAKTK